MAHNMFYLLTYLLTV